MNAQPAAPETKADYVYRTLRDDIVSGRIGSGERLRLTALAERLQTSEMPVREALRMLQRDGLVDMESHRGATVASVDWERVIEAVAVRMHLEVLAVRDAVPNHSPRTVEKAAGYVVQMDRALERHNPDAFSDANRRFHSALYEPGNNELLKRQIDDLWDLVWRERSRSLFRLDPERGIEAQREHRSLLAAVGNKDVEGAARAAEDHRRRTLDAWETVRHSP